MKLKHKILYLSIIIVLLIAAGIFYIFSINSGPSKDLTKYLPSETVFFAEYNLQNKDLLKYTADNKNQIRLNKLLNKSNFLGDLSSDLLAELDKLALVIVDNYGQYEELWLMHSQNIHRLAALEPKEYFESNLDSNTIALATNRELFKMIKDQNPLDENAFEQRKIISKFSADNFFNIYFSSKYLKHLSQTADLTYHLIFSPLNIDNTQPAFLGIKIADNQMAYEFSAQSLSTGSSNNFSADFQSELNKLNFNSANFFNFVSADLSAVLDGFTNSFSKDEIQELEEKYEFAWKDLKNILDNPGFIFTQAKSNLVNKQQLFDLQNYNYLIAVQTGLSSEELTAKISQIKQVIKNILAYKYPSYITHRLPDGTPSTEIVADPEIFSFEKMTGFEYLEFSAVNLAIGLQDNYLLLANNKDLMQNFLEFTTPAENNFKCDLTGQNEIVVLNTQKIYQSFLSNLNQIIININHNKKDLELSGCFNF